MIWEIQGQSKKASMEYLNGEYPHNTINNDFLHSQMGGNSAKKNIYFFATFP